VRATDALDELDSLSGIAFNHAAGCPNLGSIVGTERFGDLNCDNNVSPPDVVRLLEYVDGLPLAHVPPCPDIGHPLS